MLLDNSIPRSQKNMQSRNKLLTVWFLTFMVSLMGYKLLQTPVISTVMLLSALAVTTILLFGLFSKIFDRNQQEEN
ncbi:hypothetical protein TU67_05245 [Bacillus cereus]|nr:hypothetical protein TU67_05245 [Bacillus cereus]